MNPGDIPYVKGEMEISYKRRLRRIRIQSKFTHNMAEVDAGKINFPAGDALKRWLTSEEAASIF